jgi:5-methylcytosine-specific restriction endonuclease McrA
MATYRTTVIILAVIMTLGFVEAFHRPLYIPTATNNLRKLAVPNNYVERPEVSRSSILNSAAMADPLENENDMLDFQLISAEAIERNYRKIGTQLDNSPVLVLNADYTPLSHLPLSLWNWQDALKAIFNDKAVVVSEYDLIIRSVSCEIAIPSVIALKSFYRKPESTPSMTREKVFLRDGYTCQYCSERFRAKELSLDHVIPRSRGGKLTWTNTVTACLACNYKKGHTLPDQLPGLGMKLKSQPRAPTFSELQNKARKASMAKLHPDWKMYL